MAPPIIKIIELLTDKKDNLFNFLDNQDFNERPTLISLQKFDESEELLIEYLEEYFTNKQYLYPVYFQVKNIGFPSKLNLVRDLNEVPAFFKQKTKQLNIKENLVFNKIKLKQEQLKNFNLTEINPIIKEYSTHHKKIKEKSDFLSYLDQVIKDIRSKHES